MPWLDYRIWIENTKRDNSKTNGTIYRHINKRVSNGKGIGTLIDASDSPVTNDKEKAN